MKILTMTIAHGPAAHMLAEAIESAPFADAHLVVDTSPGRPEVQHVVDTLNDPTIHVRPWPWREDFSAARNHLLQQAATFVEPEEATWGVTLDTDERFACADSDATRAEFEGCDPNIGTCSVYDTTDFYTKVRCFRLPTQANFVGPTHEVAIDTGPQLSLRTWKFWELGKSAEQVREKLLRDERILRKHAKQHPKDPRWWYYLGDTLSNLGKQQEAFDAFMRCAGLRGWDEEGGWACYRAATIQLDQSKFREAIETCAKGLSRHPGMGELAWVAAVGSFRAQMPDKAACWASIAVTLGSHKGIDANSTRSGFRYLPALFELPYDILRFALPTEGARKNAEEEFWAAKLHRYGGPSFEHVALRRGHDGVRWEARNDIGRKIKPLGELAQDVKLQELPNPSAIGYHPMNPSICVHEGRLVMSIRTVNYVIDDAGSYVIPEGDQGVIKTENFLVDVDPDDFGISNIRHITDKTGKQRYPTSVRGHEDLRLASIDHKLYACATVRDHAPHMPCDLAVCEFDGANIVREWVQSTGRTEKNWMPLVLDGRLCFVYSLDPTILRRFDPVTGAADETAKSTPGLALDHLRGGSQAVLLPDGKGWLAVTHEVVHLDNRRRYLHRFVRLGSDLRVTHVSRSWTFRPTLSIEFVAGMALHQDRILLSVGFDDRQAWLASLPLDQAMTLASAFYV